MSKQCGIWIDHREAVLVLPDDNGSPKVERVTSDVFPKTRRRGGSPGVTAKAGRRAGARGRSSGIQEAMPEDKIDRKYRQQLERYYERVIDAIGDRTSIVVFGPGQARDELARTIEEVGRGRHTVWTQAAEAGTEAQIVAFVREFFATP